MSEIPEWIGPKGPGTMIVVNGLKEKPILFKPELVKAILDGKKTQTRRIIKPQPFDPDKDYGKYFKELPEQWNCPYGKVGDVLWVRETWGLREKNNGVHTFQEPVYKADWLDIQHIRVFESVTVDGEQTEITQKWKPSIHMPRKYCRLRLKTTDIKVERLQDITTEGILAEGVGNPSKSDKRLLDMWIHLWDSINAKRGFPWESNPWLWVLKWPKVKK